MADTSFIHNGHIIKLKDQGDGTFSFSAEIENLGDNAYDSTNDSMKVISQGASYKLITISNLAAIANGETGNTGWLNDNDVKRAKAITLYYTANQSHDLITKFDPDNPASVGYFGATTNAPYHSGTVGGLGGISERFTMAINDGNVNFYFTNKSGGDDLAITNIKVRLQF